MKYWKTSVIHFSSLSQIIDWWVGGCELVRPSWHFPLSNLLSEPNHFILRKKQRELCGGNIGSFRNSGFGSQEILTEKISNQTLRFRNKTMRRICFTPKWSISIFDKLGVNICPPKVLTKVECR